MDCCSSFFLCEYLIVSYDHFVIYCMRFSNVNVESIDCFKLSEFTFSTSEPLEFHPLKHPHSKDAICFILSQSLLCLCPCHDKKTCVLGELVGPLVLIFCLAALESRHHFPKILLKGFLKSFLRENFQALHTGNEGNGRGGNDPATD